MRAIHVMSCHFMSFHFISHQFRSVFEITTEIVDHPTTSDEEMDYRSHITGHTSQITDHKHLMK
jgi:hypothetical protein